MKYMSCLTKHGLKILEKGAEFIYQWDMFFVGCAHILLIKLLRHKVWGKKHNTDRSIILSSAQSFPD